MIRGQTGLPQAGQGSRSVDAFLLLIRVIHEHLALCLLYISASRQAGRHALTLAAFSLHDTGLPGSLQASLVTGCRAVPSKMPGLR